MPITAACPSCSQKLQVDDQFAGKQVRCPKCGNTMTMPRADVPTASVVAEPPLASPISSPIEPLPAGAPGPGFLETVQRSLAAYGQDQLSITLFQAGVVCLAGMILFTFLPWFSPGIVTVLGISVYPGILNFLLSAAALAFVIVTLVVVKKKDTFRHLPVGRGGLGPRGWPRSGVWLMSPDWAVCQASASISRCSRLWERPGLSVTSSSSRSRARRRM